MNQFDYKQFYGRNLPHIQPPGATLFVTFRLADSIPKAIMEEWFREKKQLEMRRLRREVISDASLDSDEEVEEKLSFQRRWFGKFETLLHTETIGPLWLKEERVAAIVEEALHYRDGKVYRLAAFCIMANHVHTVFTPLLTEAEARKLAINTWRQKQPIQTNNLSDDSQEDEKTPVLSAIMQSLKGYTARKCNLALGRTGTFWQHESFDHVIRDEDEFDRIIKYTLNNPVKARLVNQWQEWRWSYCRPSLLSRL